MWEQETRSVRLSLRVKPSIGRALGEMVEAEAARSGSRVSVADVIEKLVVEARAASTRPNAASRTRVVLDGRIR